MKNLDLTSTVAYDETAPIKETVKATGRLFVSLVAGSCEAVEFGRDLFVLGRLTLKGEIYDAESNARTSKTNSRKKAIVELQDLAKVEKDYDEAIAALK